MSSFIHRFRAFVKLDALLTYRRELTYTTVVVRNAALPIYTPVSLKTVSEQRQSSVHEPLRSSSVVSGCASTPTMPVPSSKEYADAIRLKYGIATPIGDNE